MTLRRAAILLLAAASAAACRGETEGPASPRGPTPLSEAVLAGSGVVNAPLREVAAPRTRRSAGVVVDPASLIQLSEEADAASAALASSESERERLAALHAADQNASLREVEEAEARAETDRGRLRSARERIALEWGRDRADLSAPRRRELVARLARGQAAFVRTNLESPDPPAEAEARLVGAPSVAARAIRVEPSPRADASLPGRTYLLEIATGDARFPPGAAVEVESRWKGGEERGLALPESAVVRYAGRAWVFVLGSDGIYQRREIDLDRARSLEGDPPSWFVPGPPERVGLAAGDRVVVTGAESVLSCELRTVSSAPPDAD